MASVPRAEGASPAMAQWFACKAEHPDALIFFRMGDFYELFFADAEAAATALDIALTQRGEHAGAPIPMCGVPVHAAEAYLARLIRRGFRVAVAEQLEDPKSRTTRGPLRRDVVRLVTPGTITEDALLEAGRSNFLLGLAQNQGRVGAAWLDMSTGLFETAVLAPPELQSLLARLDPAEIVAADDIALGEWSAKRSATQVPSPPLLARQQLAAAFGVASLEAFGTFSDAEAVAAALALDYVRATQAGTLPRLTRPSPQGNAAIVEIDAATRLGLELHRARDGAFEHTLQGAVQRTLTSAGARKLAAWLGSPLTDPTAIAARQDAWSWLACHPDISASVRLRLRATPDTARALARLSLNRGGPRDLAAVRDGLAAARGLCEALDGPLPILLDQIRAALSGTGPELVRRLTEALVDSPPHKLDDGGLIRPGFDAELDAERGLRDDSRRILAAMQRDCAERYGVANLKIRHHAQLGYVIEVPAASVDGLRAFPELTLRQGMANGARFSTPDLALLNRRIVEASERAMSCEQTVFGRLVRLALDQADAIAAGADALAMLDVIQSAAKLAEPGTWCRPVVTEGDELVIRAGRHPVVEAALGSLAPFVPNDCELSADARLLLLTGPNMAGKSTYLRQNALIVILAQAGLPVPAESARIGVVDRLFSRIGASDELARGRSTFMVEMTETAAILRQAGPRSLVVVDEIGRGTATLDGLAIAWAVLEALHSALRCRTIFATHFHELAELSDRLPRLRPHTMRVKEWKGTVVFLHEVAAGAAKRSWGVHVAELAGVPAPVVRRAAHLLALMEKHGGPLGPGAPLGTLPLFSGAVSVEGSASPDEETDPLHRAMVELDPDSLTPREALEALYRLKALLPVSAAAKS